LAPVAVLLVFRPRRRAAGLGAFTGMQAIRPQRGERVFAAAPDRVFELQHRRRRHALDPE
jgi:hypothetical protein